MRRLQTRRMTRTRATFGGTLVLVDEPEVIYLRTLGSAIIVAVAADDAPDRFPFFGAEVSGDQWQRYLAEEVDLRYLLLFPKYKRWFQFDLLDRDGEEYRLASVTYNNDIHSRWIPEAGFFARSHTHIPEDLPVRNVVTQSFAVDGAWNLSDFSSFYARVSDIYVFFGGLKNWADETLDAETRRRVRSAFEHPWRGGFSYVSFFEQLFSAQPYSDRLAVRSIQYASPGHVDVDGKAEVFENITHSLEAYGSQPTAHKEAYNRIYKALQEGGYLRLDPHDFDTNSAESALFLRQAREVFASIGVENIEVVRELSQGNGLVALKVALAISRRTEALFKFFAEGRAQIPDHEVVEL